eukprot:m.209560 g.209560  ORF g.209560 m.209560 type:complete len:307 (-) comp25468_c1_seq2:2115-3035(-)
MGRRSKHHRAQPPTTIIVPNFELTDSEAQAQSPESWEGYPDPKPSPRYKATRAPPAPALALAPAPAPAPRAAPAAVLRPASAQRDPPRQAYSGNTMRVSIPRTADDDSDDSDGDEENIDYTKRNNGKRASLTPSPTTKDSSHTYASLAKEDAMRLVLPNRALTDPFAAADPFAVADPFTAEQAPLARVRASSCARTRGSSTAAAAIPVQTASSSTPATVGTITGHARALKGAIPLEAAAPQDLQATGKSGAVPWPELISKKNRSDPGGDTAVDTAVDPFGSPVKASASDAPFGGFDAFAPETSVTA